MGNTALKHAEGWKAELSLGLKARTDKTVLARRHQRGPLAVQRPFYPEGNVCHLYLLHPPGGVVGSDELSIKATVACGASALVTTPGATKFYRSAGAWAFQQQTLRVESGATLEWLPQENIFFSGGHSRLSTKIELMDDAKFIGWETQCLGRPANGERFDSGCVEFQMKLLRNKKPLLIEKFTVGSKQHLDALSGLHGNPVLATLIATGIDSELLDSLQHQFGRPDQCHIGFTLLEDILVCRYLGDSTEQARNLFIQIWQEIRPKSIQREACAPRIWST